MNTPTHQNQLRQWAILLGVALLVLAIDQATKFAVLGALSMGQSLQPVPALVPYFQITLSANMGAAFGFLAGTAFASQLFLGLSIAVVIGLLIAYPRLTEGRLLAQVALALVVGGAVGNIIDRILYGYVVDFIHYRLPNVISNVSNLADHAIVLGVGLMIFATWRNGEGTPPTDGGEQS